MKSRNLLAATAAAAVGTLIGSVTVLVIRKLTEPGPVEPLRVGEPFPSMTGHLLSGAKMTIPDEMLGRVGVIIGGWDYAARFEVESWGMAVLEIYGERPDLTVLEVPWISGVGPVMRRVIDAAMERGTMPEARRHVLTVYGDLRRLRKRLAVANYPPQAYIYVLGRTGRLAWKTNGAPTPEKFAALKEALADQGVTSWEGPRHTRATVGGNGHAEG